MPTPRVHPLLLATALLCAAPLDAQAPPCADSVFDPSLGTALNSGDEVLSTGLQLQFPFQFPDGTITQTIDISSNGRIAPAGVLPGTNFTPSVSTLLAGPSVLCPYWADLTFQGGDVFFDSRVDRAIITWSDAELFIGSTPFTFQAQLFDDGRIRFVYDDRFGVGAGLIGFSRGGQVSDPGPTDLTYLPGSVDSSNTVYEGFGEHDLTGLYLEWTPEPVAGYRFDNECARSQQERPSCAQSNNAFRFSPDGSGGYNVDRLLPTFDANVGAPLVLADDSLARLTLGFSFPMPGGTATTSLDLDSNGRLILPGSVGSDFSPTDAELLNDPTPTIAALWTDFNPAAGGTVSFVSDTQRALITFEDVPQFDETNANTFQVALFADGTIEIHLVHLELIVDPRRTPQGDNVLIGLSQGSGASMTPEIDLSTALPLSSAGSPDIYEFLDVANGGEEIDFPTTFETTTVGRPVIGGSFDLLMTGVPPGTTSGTLLLGILDAGLELTFLLPLGVPSCTLTPFPLTSAPLAVVNGTSAPLTLQVPNDRLLLGGTLFVQSTAFATNLNPANIAVSNSLRLVLGL